MTEENEIITPIQRKSEPLKLTRHRSDYLKSSKNSLSSRKI